MADFSIAATARKSQATANGSTTQFAFAFSVNVEGDIAVYVNTTLKTISTHYTVSITANTGAGSITFTSGNTPSDGQIVTIMSKTALARTSVYTSGGTISASALESDFDTNMMLFGQLQEQIDRTIKFPVQDATSLTSTLPIGTSRAGFLTFDASGNVTIDTLPAGDLTLETGDGAILSLTSTDTTITADSVLGAINFSAPSEASGTDAILTGAAIEAVAEGTFAADSNATKLLFKTGSSEAATTKMTLTSAGNLTVTGALTAGSLVIGSADIAEVEFEMIDGITAGTVAASKAVVVDANKDISSFRNLTATGAVTVGSLVVGSADISETELEMLDGITAGTVAASKAVVVDANKDISSFRNLTASGAITGGSLVIGSADIAEAELEMIDGITAGTILASKAVVVDANKDISSFRNLTATGSFIIGSASMNETDLEKIDGIVNGQGAANKALVLDASSDIENIRNVTATGFFKIGNASMNETDLEKLDGITNGTVEADKALVVDSNKKLNELLVDHLSLDSRTLSSTESNGHLYITPNGTGNVYVHTDTLHILAADSEYARIQLSADNSDDPGDDWIIQSNTDNTFQIGNDISGSAVTHLTITPHATVASSIAAFAGKITSGGAIEPASLSIHNTTSAASVYLQQDASGPQPLSKFFMIMNGGPQSYDSDTAYIHVDDGTINIKPAAGVSGASVSVDGVVDITDSTDATDATGDTGALRTEGGASIAKKLYVGTDLDVTGTTQLDGAVTLGVAGASNGFINSPSGIFVNIDSDNNQTDRFFDIRKDSTDGSGTLLFQVQESGNVGIGVSDPSTWSLGKALHIGNKENNLWGEADYAFHMNQNAYYNSGWKYSHTDEATQYTQADGQHIWSYAASGTADAALTWSEAMRIDSSGNLLVGKTSASGTSSSSGDDGLEIRPTFLSFQANTVAAYLNTRTDGNIAVFQKDGSAVGLVGSRSGVVSHFVFDPRTNGSGLSGGTDQIQPTNNTGGITNGALSIGSGTTRFKDLYLSGGVYLGGTGAANLLDDYEEGTFTPSWENVSDATFTVNLGVYTKIGKVVSCQIHIDINALNSASGDVAISNLPFTTDSTANLYGSTTAIHSSGWSAQRLGLNGLVLPNTTRVLFYYQDSNGDAQRVTWAMIDTGNLICTIIYFVP